MYITHLMVFLQTSVILNVTTWTSLFCKSCSSENKEVAFSTIKIKQMCAELQLLKSDVKQKIYEIANLENKIIEETD